MEITRTFYGFCPILTKDYSIEVEYEDAGTLNSPNRYIQGLVTCIHHGFNGCPNTLTCPIKARVPKEISA